MSASEGEIEVEEILGERKSRRGLEYLVRWKGFGSGEDSWEPLKNLKHAVHAITDFHAKSIIPQKKKGRKSTSRSRSRSRSTSRGRSGSKSPGRKKKASPTRSSTKSSKTVTKTTVKETPTINEKRVETLTTSPGRVARSTEVYTKSYTQTPETQRVATVSRTTEVHTSTIRSDQTDGVNRSPMSQHVKSLRNRAAGVVRSDYPAMVVFITIAIVVLSFVVQEKVDFEAAWKWIVATASFIWAWLTGLVGFSK